MSNSDRNQIESALRAGALTAEATERFVTMGDSEIPVAFLPTDEGGMKAEVLTAVLALDEQRAEAPRRLKGVARLTELESFIQHVNRFKDSDSVIFADVEKAQLTAVLNYHEAAQQAQVPAEGSEVPNRSGAPRWADHRSIYTCPLSQQWKAWMSGDGKWMSQSDFGEWLEANIKDLANPDGVGTPAPAALLQVARNLRVHAKTEFEQKINPSTGEGSFVYKKDNEIQGSTTVPSNFELAIPVFEAGEFYRIPVRLRYKVETPEGGGKAGAKFRYEMETPQVIVRHAFDSVRKKAAEGTGLPILAGSPES